MENEGKAHLLFHVQVLHSEFYCQKFCLYIQLLYKLN